MLARERRRTMRFGSAAQPATPSSGPRRRAPRWRPRRSPGRDAIVATGRLANARIGRRVDRSCRAPSRPSRSAAPRRDRCGGDARGRGRRLIAPPPSEHDLPAASVTTSGRAGGASRIRRQRRPPVSARRGSVAFASIQRWRRPAPAARPRSSAASATISRHRRLGPGTSPAGSSRAAGSSLSAQAGADATALRCGNRGLPGRPESRPRPSTVAKATPMVSDNDAAARPPAKALPHPDWGRLGGRSPGFQELVGDRLIKRLK